MNTDISIPKEETNDKVVQRLKQKILEVNILKILYFILSIVFRKQLIQYFKILKIKNEGYNNIGIDNTAFLNCEKQLGKRKVNTLQYLQLKHF